MIPIAEINKFSAEYGVPAETIEKDYVICWILNCLSSNKHSVITLFSTVGPRLSEYILNITDFPKTSI